MLTTDLFICAATRWRPAEAAGAGARSRRGETFIGTRIDYERGLLDTSVLIDLDEIDASSLQVNVAVAAKMAGCQVAAALGLDRFAVLGISGGGPYAAVCAWKLSDRLTGAGIVSGLAPLDVLGVIAGMGWRNRLSFQLVGRLAVLRRVLFAAMAVSVRRRPDRILERGVGAAVDKDYLGRPDVRKIPVASLSEAFRSGSRGPAWEMGLYARPWGFRLEDIRTPVHLSHGEQDANAPVAMGRHLATSIPECRASFYSGEGHLHFVDRLPEILGAGVSLIDWLGTRTK